MIVCGMECKGSKSDSMVLDGPRFMPVSAASSHTSYLPTSGYPLRANTVIPDNIINISQLQL